MTRRICAWSLVVLTLLPFTPPFATCDAGTLFGRDPLPSEIVPLGRSGITPTKTPVSSEATSVSPFRLQTAAKRARTLAVVPRVVSDRNVSARASSDRARAPQQPLDRTTVLRI